MTALASLPFPGSRALAACWRSFASLHPRSLWFVHLPVHRVEALVRRRQRAPISPLDRLLLEAADLHAAPDLDALVARVHLDATLACATLRTLAEDGLLVHDGRGFRPSSTGRDALREGEHPRSTWERSTFHFHHADVVDDSARFLPLDEAASDPRPPWPDSGSLTFRPSWLAECAARPEAWKRARGFPGDVTGVDGPELRCPLRLPEWQRVVVDRVEWWTLAVILVDSRSVRHPEARDLVGFQVQQDTWKPSALRPCLRLGECWREALPWFDEESNHDEWDRVFGAWRHSHHLDASLPEGAAFEVRDCQLVVDGPADFLSRIRPHLRAEQWLLAGEGVRRQAAQIVVPPATS